MLWIVLGVVLALALTVLVPFPWSVVVGAGLVLGVLMYTAALLEQLLRALTGPAACSGPGERAEPDPERLLQRARRARLAPREKFRLKRSDSGGR